MEGNSRLFRPLEGVALCVIFASIVSCAIKTGAVGEARQELPPLYQNRMNIVNLKGSVLVKREDRTDVLARAIVRDFFNGAFPIDTPQPVIQLDPTLSVIVSTDESYDLEVFVPLACGTGPASAQDPPQVRALYTVYLDGLSGQIKAESDSGEVLVSRCTGPIDALSGPGCPVTLRSCGTLGFVLSGASADLEFEAILPDLGRASYNTLSADGRILLRPARGLAIDIEMKGGGKAWVDERIPHSIEPATYPDGPILKINGGSVPNYLYVNDCDSLGVFYR